MEDDKESHGISLALQDKTGALLMLDKKERKLVKELLVATFKSQAYRDWISKKLGPEYLQVGEKLIKTMGGDEPSL